MFLPRYVPQLLLGDPKVFPRQTWYVISYVLGLPQGSTGKNPNKMLEPPRLAAALQAPSRCLSSSPCPQGWAAQTSSVRVVFCVTPTWEVEWAAWRSSASCLPPGSAAWPTHRAAWWRVCGPLYWTSGRTASETWGWRVRRVMRGDHL